MTLTLLLYWFPIFLGVVVGVSALGGLPRPRAAVVAVLCAIFWIALVQSHLAQPFWHGASILITTLAGAGAIVVVGCAGSARPPVGAGLARAEGAATPTRVATGSPMSQTDAEPTAAGVAQALRQFEAWLNANRHQDDPWADFDEFLRGMIYQWVGGTHVRTFRVLDTSQHLVPLREPDTDAPAGAVSARTGVIGYVATTGRSYVAGDFTQGNLLEQLSVHDASATDSPASPGAASMAGPVWCFAVTRRRSRIGVVVVGDWHGSGGPERGAGTAGDRRIREELRLLELTVNLAWNALVDAARGRAAVTTDPGSGVLTRAAFFQAGSEGLAEAFRADEPVAVAILALEGIRSLDDDGHWDAADDIRGVVSSAIRQRLRAEDRIGRFDDSRFILLLRRVDSELAQLIMRELLIQVSSVLRARKPYADRLELRCGLAGTGVTHAETGCPESSLRALTSTAIDACVRARKSAARMASDVCPAATGAVAHA